MEKQDEQILLDKLLTQRSNQGIAKLTIILSVSGLVIGLVLSVLIAQTQISKARQTESVIDLEGYVHKAYLVDIKRTQLLRFKAAVKDGFKYAYSHNEYSYKTNMENARHFYDKKSMDIIEAEYEREKRLTKLATYNLDYSSNVDIYNGIQIDMDNKPISGKLIGVQIRKYGDEEIKIEISATFKLYQYDAGVSEKNINGIKIYDWEWTERKIDEKK